MTEPELRELERKNYLRRRRESIFGKAAALYDCRFDRDNGSVPALTEVKRYADRWEEMRSNNIGLLLWGVPGTGKTFAAACVANALCEKWLDVRMTTIGCMLNKLPSMTPQEKLDYLDSLIHCDLLILDDFGMERQTDYAQEQVFNLIDGRYLARKPLLVTTNLTLKELKTPVDIVEHRIYERILEQCVPICFDSPSQRPRKAKDTLARYKELTRTET